MWEKLAALLEKSKRAVFFGGAGVSTESGIPDFRSETGLYSTRQTYGHTPEEIISHRFFVRNPQVFYSYYLEHLIYPSASPNAAHLALAALERADRLRAVVTQNIDGLHQAAGSRAVYELHGSVYRNYCVDCGDRYSLHYVLHTEHRRGHIPLCSKCGGIVRPDVVLYEESLDEVVVAGAVAAVRGADLLIVGGTSLAVYPAAGMLRYFEGDALVLINRTPTQYDYMARLVIHDSIGEVLSQAVSRVCGDFPPPDASPA